MGKKIRDFDCPEFAATKLSPGSRISRRSSATCSQLRIGLVVWEGLWVLINMLKTRQCLLGIRTFLSVTSRIWGFIMYILRKHLRTVRRPLVHHLCSFLVHVRSHVYISGPVLLSLPPCLFTSCVALLRHYLTTSEFTNLMKSKLICVQNSVVVVDIIQMCRG